MSTQLTPEKRREVAAKVGANEQYLYQCLTGRRDMNPTEARRIEDETGGLVTRKMLCQKTWAGIWRELAEEGAPPVQERPANLPSGEPQKVGRKGRAANDPVAIERVAQEG
jgi:hypothetical protein